LLARIRINGNLQEKGQPCLNIVATSQHLSLSNYFLCRIRSGVGQKIEQSPSLVLNADYTPLSHLPLSLWCWQDTLRAVFSGKAVVVSEYSDLLVRSVSCSFPLPSVIALTNYQKCPNQIPVMSRRNVYIRDGFKCQVCRITLTVCCVASVTSNHELERNFLSVVADFLNGRIRIPLKI
jgi:hypothetical protein